MEKNKYSLRCQDLHNAIHTNVDPTSGYLTDYKSTRLIGMAGQVISTIHGMDVVDYQRFEPIAAHQYGIDSMWLEKVFYILQECDLVNVIGKKSAPEKIHVKSKYLKSNYEVLSEYLVEDMEPKDIEISAIDLLQYLSLSPLTSEDIKSRYNLSDEEISNLKLFGSESQLLQFTNIDKENYLISTPMYWDENAETAHKIIKKFSTDHFRKVIKKIKAYQGLPTENFSNPVVKALVSKGILPTPVVRMESKDHHFLFTPYNLIPEEKIILEKARDILACVRCGQHFARYPITSPVYILNALLDNTRSHSLKPTTVAKEQYFLLASKGIGLLMNTGGNWYSFKLIDTPENIRAVKLALELLEHGEKVETQTDKNEEIRQFIGTRGTSLSAFKSIKDANKKKNFSPEMAGQLVSLIQGAYMYKGGNYANEG